MHDLQIWRTLRDPDASPEARRSALAALAEHPARWALFDQAEQAASDPDPKVRAAGLRALDGATGFPAWKLLSHALDDGDGSVREAALLAFAQACRDDPSRWLIALCHPRRGVRLQAFDMLPERDTDVLRIRLLGDEDLRPRVRTWLLSARRAPALIALAWQHHQAGHLALDDVYHLVAALGWPSELGAVLKDLPVPTRVEPSASGLRVTAHAGPDEPVPLVVELLCTGEHAGHPGVTEAVGALLDRALRGALPVEPHISLSNALIARHFGHGRPVPPRLLAVAGAIQPALAINLNFEAVWTSFLRHLAPFRPPDHLPRLDGHHLARPREACLTPSLDLRALTGLLTFATEEDWLLSLTHAALPREVLVEALCADPECAAWLLGPIRRASPQWALRSELTEAIAAHSPDLAEEVLFLQLLRRPSQWPPGLNDLPVPTLGRLVARLDAAAQDHSLRPNGVGAVARTLQASAGRLRLIEAILDAEVDAGQVARAVLLEALGIVAPRQVVDLGVQRVQRLLDLDAAMPVMPFAAQQNLAKILELHPHPPFREWAARAAPQPSATPRFEPGHRRPLSRAEHALIATCTPVMLEEHLQVALHTPVSRMVEALDARRTEPVPHGAALAALLLSHDRVDHVLRCAATWGADDPDTFAAAERLLIHHASERSDVGPLAGMVLWRWDRGFQSFRDWLSPGMVGDVLRASLGWPSIRLRADLFRALRHLAGTGRWHAREETAALFDDDAVEALVELFHDAGASGRGPCGYPTDSDEQDAITTEAAAILVRLIRVRSLRDWRPRVEGLRGELCPTAQATLRPWLQHREVVPATPVRTAPSPVEDSLLDQAVADEDVVLLGELCCSARRGTVETAVLTLLDLGACEPLADALLHDDVAHRGVITESVPDWPPALHDRLLDALASGLPPDVAVHVTLGLLEAGRDVSAHLPTALAEGRVDANTLARLRAVTDADALARVLIANPTFTAYRWAVEHAVDHDDRTAWHPDLAAFLELPERSREVRLDAARALRDLGDATGVWLIVDDCFRAAKSRTRKDRAVTWAQRWPADDVVAVTRAGLLAGEGLVPGKPLVDGLLIGNVAVSALEPALLDILAEASRPALQRRALDGLPTRTARSNRARNLAEMFLWGKDQARKLLGRRYTIQYLVGEDLGLTRLEHPTIYVNPMPFLRGEENGASIVRGLIVHELGHHLYNADEDGLAVWKEAHEAGLGRLLNVVMDEHLERNLRAIDPAYGDDLKQLGAWAFLHARHTLQVGELLARLGPHLAEVLASTPIAPARERGQLQVPLGRLFRALEADRSSFARFFRALRMGLGDRWGDPKVAEGLALFDKSFRKADNRELWRITKELARIFGDETDLLDLVDVHEVAAGEGGDDPLHGKGVTNTDVQREVKRIEGDRDGIRDRNASDGKTSRTPPSVDAMNVGSDEGFHPITHVEVLPYDAAAARELGRDVSREARHLAQALERLGLRYRMVGPRVQGIRVDRSRLLGAALRGDPRVLQARQRVFAADLHLSVVVDCSGSMSGGRMERAQRMAAVLAEAARNLDGVDLRLFGFTDSTIYDAGDEHRCAAHALEAGGGNNDAAGLWHAAQNALASPRKARLVVMISDGLPTECTTAALRALVHRLERRHRLPCAQIAVERLSERCFPTYLEVLDHDTGAAVRRFASLVAGLVARTLRA